METGDRIKKRGFQFLGTIAKMDETWCTVDWDDGVEPKVRPKMCHVKELENERTHH